MRCISLAAAGAVTAHQWPDIRTDTSLPAEAGKYNSERVFISLTPRTSPQGSSRSERAVLLVGDKGPHAQGGVQGVIVPARGNADDQGISLSGRGPGTVRLHRVVRAWLPSASRWCPGAWATTFMRQHSHDGCHPAAQERALVVSPTAPTRR